MSYKGELEALSNLLDGALYRLEKLKSDSPIKSYEYTVRDWIEIVLPKEIAKHLIIRFKRVRTDFDVFVATFNDAITHLRRDTNSNALNNVLYFLEDIYGPIANQKLKEHNDKHQ